MKEDLLKPYDHNANEDLIYKEWEESGFFNPDNIEGKKDSYFSIIMPPPNANGSLHVGHAVMITLEDMLIRYWRLKGKASLWFPGADHAGFETQVVFEKKLEKEGTSRFKILKEDKGRDKLYNMIWDFTQDNKVHMEKQVRRLGASCDWTREKFTLDKDVIEIVYKTFKKLYDDGLVYRAKRIVNWCVKHQTSLSDLEIKWMDKEDKLFYVNYKFANKGGYLTIATVRPETIPGDVAVAVNPKDKRFNDLIGEEVIEPITKRKIPVISDDSVDIEFGTGALKITPANDPTDFEIGERHSLSAIQILNSDGRFNELAGPLDGMKVLEAREKAIEILKSEGVFEKEENYNHQVGTCYKCNNVLEPMLMDQWFIDLTGKGKEKIVKPAIDAVKRGKIKIVPGFQEKIFYHWMNNIRDWNISRQIVWGREIPVWYCEECDNVEVVIDGSSPKKCSKCGSNKLKKETDVFDTWFSSGQWPFALLMSQNNKDVEKYYPTSVMETGYDILFFWVARMIMMSLYVMKKIPFESVYLHGLVRDKDKKKMSKSKGNVVDPLGVVEQYGADALRMALIVGNSPGRDVVYDENKIKGYRNFSNKIWNIARFILENSEKNNFVISEEPEKELSSDDKKSLDKFNKIKKKVSEDMEKSRFSQSAETAYHYVWHTFADEIIESKKEILNSDDEKLKKSSLLLLNILLKESLLILHPFMPFVTEAIYQRLPKKDKKFLMIENW